MSKYIKIECGASISFQGCEAIDVYTTDITTEEWEVMDQDKKDEVLQEYLDNHLNNYTDFWVDVVD